MKALTMITLGLLTTGAAGQGCPGCPASVTGPQLANNIQTALGLPFLLSLDFVPTSQGTYFVAAVGGPDAMSTSAVSGIYDETTNSFTPDPALNLFNSISGETVCFIDISDDKQCAVATTVSGKVYVSCEQDSSGHYVSYHEITTLLNVGKVSITGEEGAYYLIYNDSVIDTLVECLLNLQTWEVTCSGTYTLGDVTGSLPTPPTGFSRSTSVSQHTCPNSRVIPWGVIIEFPGSFTIGIAPGGRHGGSIYPLPLQTWLAAANVGSLTFQAGKALFTDTTTGLLYEWELAFGNTILGKAGTANTLLLRGFAPPRLGQPTIFAWAFGSSVPGYSVPRVVGSLITTGDFAVTGAILGQNGHAALSLPIPPWRAGTIPGQLLYLDTTLGTVFAANATDIVLRDTAVLVEAVGTNSFNSVTTSGFWRVVSAPGNRVGAITGLRLDLSSVLGSSMFFDTDQSGMADRFDGGSAGVATCVNTYRNGSDVATGLIYRGTTVGACPANPAPTGWTGTKPQAGNPISYQTLEFQFAPGSFLGRTFEFDCDTDGGPGVSGGAMAGTIVVVTTASGTSLLGVLGSDPMDPNRAFVEFR